MSSDRKQLVPQLLGLLALGPQWLQAQHDVHAGSHEGAGHHAGKHMEGDHLKKLFNWFNEKMGEFDTFVSVGKVTGFNSTHFTFDNNLLPDCEGSLVVNLSKEGFVWQKGAPKNLKFMGVVVAGNLATNSNIGQFNFDYNKHVFNNSSDEFNKVSDKI
eukprot:CAMPEP_0116933816 /NCGR_PEP_ID=MMETSP0467-20121206/29272_1 /TAXON_ID=283647 /ORGANISM="Mesodinium pulex, Strain SPMC105" /LENGTH=157 /DNA_ID=CAMNT_0004614789 /DNA_START=704 /DNA_END=1178 /DNA_ORIENTATION=+